MQYFQYRAIQYYTRILSVILTNNTMTLLFSIYYMQYASILYNTILHALYSIILYYVMPYCPIYCTVLCQLHVIAVVCSAYYTTACFLQRCDPKSVLVGSALQHTKRH